MKKETVVWIGILTFAIGQLIQLVTNAMAHYLYVSDPVMMCITVGIVTVALVVLTAIFTLMEPERAETKPFKRHQKKDDFADVIPPIFRNWKEHPIDEDAEAITEADTGDDIPDDIPLFKEYEKNTPEVVMEQY